MRSWLALGSLILVAGSWRLWTPQQLFPRVPLFSFASAWSDQWDYAITWICLALWLLATAVLAIPQASPKLARWAAACYSVLFVALVILDQHRLQPWGVHIAICLLIVTAFEARQLLSWLLAFTASIYIYSALSKFDAQFLHTVGQDFLQGLLRVWPGSFAALSDSGRFALAALFPMGELLCGLGLLWSRTRRLALAMAISMHATLIGILGPWGLAHSWGVLWWNVVFIGLNILMWRQLSEFRAITSFSFDFRGEKGSSLGVAWWRVGVSVLCWAMCVIPLGERFGVVDHWLGWALYAPHSSRARIEVLAGSADQQPEMVRRFVLAQTEGIAAWDYVAVERWSLETLGVPVYPQQRFYVAVARAVGQSTDEYGVRVTLMGTASRWSGARSVRVLENRSELSQASERFWLNTEPRW